ncbi:MAG TPA: hypothetical protein VNO26_14955 [Candidatus Limnocylindria bacterium]|nr:hypothetical protein [Candidatus Limnocylindria bacterium]
MNRRAPVVYGATLAAVVLLIVLSVLGGDRILVVGSAPALACLATDVVLAVRWNVSINAVMDRWSPTAYPEDWADQRTRWLAEFAARQVVLLVGFFALLAAAVLR